MGNSSIEWTDKTWNVVRGCRRKSKGCNNCYAERIATRFSGPGMPYEGLVTIRPRKSDGGTRHPETGSAVQGARGRWNGKTGFIAAKLLEPLGWKKPQKVFVNSMSDLFYEGFTNEQIAAQFGVMYLAHWHTFQILTKRIDRAREWFAWVLEQANATRALTVGMFCVQHLIDCFAPGSRDRARIEKAIDARMTAAPTERIGRWPLPNVWMGTSVEDDDVHDRILELLRVPAAIRFVSAEPLIGHLDVGPYVDPTGYACCGSAEICREKCPLTQWPVDETGYRRLDLVIVGCESGHGARKCDVDWIRDIVEKCTSSGVRVFVKQAKELTDREYDELDIPPEERHHQRPITAGAGSTRKGKTLIALPYIDGVQYASLP